MYLLLGLCLLFFINVGISTTGCTIHKFPYFLFPFFLPLIFPLPSSFFSFSLDDFYLPHNPAL